MTEVLRLRQRCGELERERDELQMRNDAQAYTIGSLQREWDAKNDAYNRAVEKRAEAAERERDEARAEVDRLTAVDPKTSKEIADLALKWAVAGWMSHTPEVFKAERRKFEHHVLTAFCTCARPYKDRAEAAEARLAQARADALEDAARVAEQEVTTYHEGMSAVDVRLSHARGPKWSDGPSIANAIRAIASDTDTEAATSEGE